MLEMRDSQNNLFCFADDRVEDFSQRDNFFILTVLQA